MYTCVLYIYMYIYIHICIYILKVVTDMFKLPYLTIGPTKTSAPSLSYEEQKTSPLSGVLSLRANSALHTNRNCRASLQASYSEF